MSSTSAKSLDRRLGLLGLAATGICSMIGASIYVIPFMIQRNVPGIGPYVLPAFLLAAIPAALAAFAYAILASAMPRAGGSYVYASRALGPYFGFVASFSQWFGLSIAIGVVAYLVVPFFRDVASLLDLNELAAFLDRGAVRVTLALVILWAFVWLNIRGVKLYERIVIPLMILMFLLGGIVIVAGLYFNHQDFAAAILHKENRILVPTGAAFHWSTLAAGSAVLFSSFIGFDSIAQAGGEAKDPSRALPRAIGIAIVAVTLFYVAFTFSVYHTVPWSFVAEQARSGDVTAPGLLGYVLSSGWAVPIVLGASIALLNDLPAMILSVSRLMFAWAEDGIFPTPIALIHSTHHTPYMAILLSGLMATVGVLGSHFAGDFFLGIDIMVTSMLVNYLLMCVSVLLLPRNNPEIAARVTVVRSLILQRSLSVAGISCLSLLLIVHIASDLGATVSAWYFHSTVSWFLVMLIASVIFLYYWRRLRTSGVDTTELFSKLPQD
jgi:amino acid transporter